MLMAAADGTAKAQGVSEGQEVHFTPSFPFLAGACVTSYLTKTGVLSSAL